MSDRAERKAGRPARRAPDPAPTGAEPEAAGTPAAPTDDGPTPLRVAVLALWVEAVLVAVLAAVNVVGLVSGDADRADTGIGIVLLLAMAAAALWYAGRLLVHRRQAGQGLAISLQLAAVPVAFYMASGGSGPWIAVGGVAIGLAALAVIALLLVPSSRAALPRR